MHIAWGLYVLAIAILFYLSHRAGDTERGERMSGRFTKIMEREIERSSRTLFTSMPAELKKEFGLR